VGGPVAAAARLLGPPGAARPRAAPMRRHIACLSASRPCSRGLCRTVTAGPPPSCGRPGG
jgi:hypothetical protein